MKNSIYLICLMLVMCSPTEEVSETLVFSANAHAKGFEICKTDSSTIIKTSGLWTGNESEHLYALSEKPSNSDGLSVPAKRIVCLSAPYVFMLKELGAIDRVVGMSNVNWMYDSTIIEYVNSGSIVEVGADQSLDYEMLMLLEPDVIFSFGVDASSMKSMNKLKELNLPVVYAAEYMETTPLGQAEWLRFFGAFVGKERLADSLFSQIETEYDALVTLTQEVNDRPSVLFNLPFKEVWYQPGGQSIMAQYVHDAGGDYIWSEDNQSGSLALDEEEVLVTAQDAEVWIISGFVNSLEELLLINPNYEFIHAYQQGRVYCNNNRLNEKGGNDVWESGVLYANEMLLDMIAMMHLDLLPNHELKYYKKLK